MLTITKQHRWFHLIWLVAGLMFLVGLDTQSTAAQSAPTCDWPKNFVNFYTPPANVVPTDPTGKILRVQHIRTYSPDEVAQLAGLETSQFGAEAYRILYLSRSAPDVPAVVSGTIVVPTGAVPAGGFPVIAYAFGTTGMADTCAPSRNELLIGSSLLPWIAQGYVVSATDYAGLGLPGLHPYGIGDVSGRNLLDSARAALNFCDNSHQVSQSAANEIFLQGHSQGGHAALFGHQLQASYAPELSLRGSVLMAPGSELRLLAERLAGNYPTPIADATALAMLAYSQYYDNAPTLQPWLQEPFATDLATRAEQQCIASLSAWLSLSPAKIFQPQLLTKLAAGNWSELEPWTTYIDANTPGNFSSSAPVLIIHSQEDLTVPIAASQRLSERLCRNGTPVTVKRHADANHITIVQKSRDDALTWMADRSDDRPLIDYCGVEITALDTEPVIVQAGALPEMIGQRVDQIFAYSYVNNQWKSVPIQVDEVTADGAYTSQENGLLDANDELVFMVGDLGTRAPITAPPFAMLPISDQWYEVAVTDPTNALSRRWLYIVNSQTLSPALADYVTYHDATRTVSGQGYRFGFTESGWPDSLSLGNGGDILDRFKFRLACGVPGICPITEDALPTVGAGFIKEGRIRAILHSGAMFAYGSKVTWRTPITISAPLGGDVRVSTDFSINANGATYYNANLPTGVSIDGIGDEVAATPFSPWWQISTENGAIVQVASTAGISTTLTNYYQDNFLTENTDTGDKVKFGDSGVLVQNPAASFELLYHLYVASGVQANIGAGYADASQRTLTATTTLYNRSNFRPLYLPIVQQ